MKIKRAGKKLFRMNRLEDRLYVLGICVPLMMTMFFLMFRALPGFVREFFLVPCVFHAVTGLYCPGCGGTRAAAVLFQGEILRSFFFRPIVAYTAGLYAWFMISHTVEYLLGHKVRIGLKYRSWYLYAALAVVVINLAVKNVILTAFGIDILKLLDTHALV